MGNTNKGHIDVAIVGAGMLGLAHAFAAVKRGLRVVVFERSSTPIGASIRNFGMGLVTGQPPGIMLGLAKQSRDLAVHTHRGRTCGAGRIHDRACAPARLRRLAAGGIATRNAVWRPFPPSSLCPARHAGLAAVFARSDTGAGLLSTIARGALPFQYAGQGSP